MLSAGMIKVHSKVDFKFTVADHYCDPYFHLLETKTTKRTSSLQVPGSGWCYQWDDQSSELISN